MAPVYVVSGWMRTGTSMMMQALAAGGMDAAYRPGRDQMVARYADDAYHPNGGGLWELERRDYLAAGFPAGYEGRLIKCLRRGPARMVQSPGGIRVVYMLRDPEEIRQSFMAFFPRSRPPGVRQLEAENARNLEAIRARDDVAVITMHYVDEVLADPAAALHRVADHFGVQLDVAAAAAVVDPARRRYRASELVPGIV